MELSEQNLKILEDEGYTHVYEWFDEPGVHYDPHSHREDHSIIITEGSMNVTIGNETNSYISGDRLNIPAGTSHEINIGPEGCKYVIGE